MLNTSLLRSDPSRDHSAIEQALVPGNESLRSTGILALIGIAVIHFVQLVGTFKATPLLGVAFLLLIIACVAIAVRMIGRGDTASWMAAGALSLAAIVGYGFTRVLKTPLDNVDLGNWSCMLGLAALFVESGLLLLSGWAVSDWAVRANRAPSMSSVLEGRLSSQGSPDAA
jgi:hypothetical protein